MYVRMYVCMYICTYVCMYVSTYVCMYVCITYVHMYVRMYVRICVCTYVCMYACKYVCMYVRMYVCIFLLLVKHAPLQLGNTTCYFIHCWLSWSCPTFYTLFKSAWIHGICYSWSKSIDSKKVRNESRCFVIRSCLLAGHCPAFMALFFIVCLCVSSRVQW